MNKKNLTKKVRMAIIAVAWMFVVIIASSATFVFAQKKNSTWAIFNENMTAMARDEAGEIKYTDCYMTGTNMTDGKYFCQAGSTNGSMYPCTGSVNPTFWSSKNKCYLPF